MSALPETETQLPETDRLSQTERRGERRAASGGATKTCADLAAQLSLDRDEALRVADIFKVLADPTRVLILQALTESGELCVHHLAEAVGMSQSSVSHHLRLLRNFRLIRFRRVGREVYYRPDDDHVEQLIGVCVEHIRHKD